MSGDEHLYLSPDGVSIMAVLFDTLMSTAEIYMRQFLDGLLGYRKGRAQGGSGYTAPLALIG